MRVALILLLLSIMGYAKYPILGYDHGNDALVCDGKYVWNVLKDGWSVRVEWTNPKTMKVERLKCSDYKEFDEIYIKPRKVHKD